MADNQLEVEIVAKLDQLQSGLDKATAELKSFGNSVKSAAEGGSASFKQFGESIQGTLAGGEFLIWKEIAEQAIETVKAAFESTVGAAEEFGLSNSLLAKIINTTAEEATGLSAALRGVGVDTRTYEMMSLMLDKRLESISPRLEQLGVHTRNASGHFKTGKEAMDALSEAMRNPALNDASIASEAFGRRARVMYDIMRAGKEEVEKNNEIYKQLGVVISDTSGSSAEMEDHMNLMHTALKGVGIAIGQQVMPALSEWLKSMGTSGIDILKTFILAVKALIIDLALLWTSFTTLSDVIMQGLRQLVDIFVGSFQIIDRALHWDWQGVTVEWDNMLKTMSRDSANFVKEETKKWGDLQKFVDALGAKPDLKGGARGKLGEGGDSPDKNTEQVELARIDGRMKARLAELQTEESLDKQEVALGRHTAEELFQQELDLASERRDVQVKALRDRIAVEGAHKEKVVADQQKILEVEQQYNQRKIDLTTQYFSMANKLEKEQLDQEMDNDNAKLDAKRQYFNDEEQLGHITAEQRIQLEKAEVTDFQKMEMAKLDAYILSLTKQTDAYRAAMEQRRKMQIGFDRDIAQLNFQATKESQYMWQGFGRNISTAFNTSIRGMLAGTMTFKEGMQSLLVGILDSFVTVCINMLDKWIETQIAQLIFTETTEKAKAIGSITTAAAVAGAGGVASFAMAPWPIDMGAPEFGEAMYMDAMSFAPRVAASGGMVLDKDQTVAAHYKEMILPRHISEGMQNIIANGGAAAGGSSPINVHISAVDAGSVQRLFMSNGDALMRSINAQARNLNPHFKAATNPT